MKSLSIDNLKNEEFEEFLDFDCRVYPRRELRREFYIYYFKNSDLQYYNILIAKIDNRIIGQLKYLQTTFTLNGKSISGIFGADLYVDEKARNTLAGIFLINFLKKKFKYYFGVGANKTATSVTKMLGFNKIGDIDKFFWFRNVSSLIKYSKAKSNSEIVCDFPYEIQGMNVLFHKGNAENSQVYKFNSDSILTFNRDAEFINWRLNSPKNNYHNYFAKVDDFNLYFSSRYIKWRGIKLIVIMDYSYNNSESLMLKEILSAAKKLAKEIKADGVMFPSSLSLIDTELRKNRFYKLGNPTNILSAYDFKFNEDNILKRDTVFATFADADSFLIN